MAGGMGWGIRGQYGHETGAMIAGVLVSLVIVLLFGGKLSSLTCARAVAFCALGISLGGSMTYGQTVGLTHDAPLIGNWDALRWGLVGLFIKGGIWIAIAATLLGMALGDRGYSPLEIGVLLCTLLLFLFGGVYLLNKPFDPANHELPAIYFSDDWHWEPEGELRPRPERWGGLLAVLAGLVAYAGWIKRDRLALRLALWGFLSGGTGFAVGQSVQAYHAWNVEAFRHGWFAEWDPLMNWWNMMETTFGAIFGGTLTLGVWLNRHRVLPAESSDRVTISIWIEGLLVVVHTMALLAWNFGSFDELDLVADHALPMIIIPAVGVAGGRIWPYLITLPIVALPIAGKTFRELCLREEQIPPALGLPLYIVLPVLFTSAVALLLAYHGKRGMPAKPFASVSLLVATWTYFWLNFSFFHLPWPWRAWTGRTPNALIFAICAIGLTLASVRYGRQGLRASSEDDSPQAGSG